MNGDYSCCCVILVVVVDLRSSTTSHLNTLTSTSAAAVHSTTSPEGSPNGRGIVNTNTNATSTSTATANSENDNNNGGIDTGFDSDSISVTDSPRRISSIHEDEDGRSSTPPITADTGAGGSAVGGAFTSLIQRHGGAAIGKCDLFPGFTTNFNAAAAAATAAAASASASATPSHFNPALAAQLFLQSPLLPQPRHWLYSQLYGNYNELPWFRNINASNAVTTGAAESPTVPPAPFTENNSNTNLIKKCVTLITHNTDEVNGGGGGIGGVGGGVEGVEGIGDTIQPPVSSHRGRRSMSPLVPVSSTRRSLSPLETIDLDDVGTVSKSPTSSNSSGSVSGSLYGGPLRRSNTPKLATDVWRPY